MAVHRNVGKCAFDGRSHECEAIRPVACPFGCPVCGRARARPWSLASFSVR